MGRVSAAGRLKQAIEWFQEERGTSLAKFISSHAVEGTSSNRESEGGIVVGATQRVATQSNVRREKVDTLTERYVREAGSESRDVWLLKHQNRDPELEGCVRKVVVKLYQGVWVFINRQDVS
jgi:hypothetical protein